MRKNGVWLLLLAMLVSIPGCGSAVDTEETSGDTAAANETVLETEETQLKDDLPEGLDYEGYTCQILTREHDAINYKIIAEELTGEAFNDAVYDRQKKVEERLNILLVETSDRNKDYLKNYITGGEHVFDFATLRCSTALEYFQNGYTYTYDKIPYVDLEKPWWDASVNSALTLQGIQYAAVSALDMTVYDFVNVLLFNKQMMLDNGMGDVYAIVQEGNWTMDTMQSMMTAVAADTNGDGEMDLSDQYGYVCTSKNILPSFWIASETLTITKDADDMPVFNMGSEKFYDVYSKVFEMVVDTDAWYKENHADNVPESSINLFKANQSLFMDATFFYVSSLRDMETDFGIIPYPKYDDKQDKYVSRLSFYDTLSVPLTNTELERTGVILEALSSEPYRTVIPAYYEKALKSRTSRDAESADMLDLIFNNRVIDMGDTAWVDLIRDKVLEKVVYNDDRNLSSKVASLEKSITTSVEKLAEAIANMG